MGEVFTGGNQAAVLRQSRWSTKFFEVLRQKLFDIEAVNMDYQGDASVLGQSILVSQFPDFDEANLLSEGDTGSLSDSTVTQQTITINKRPHVDFAVEDQAKLQSMSFMDAAMNSVNYALQKRVAREVLNAFVPSTSAPDHQITYVTSNTLAYADFIAATRLLDTAEVPENDRILTIGTNKKNDLFNVGEFTNRDFNGGATPIMNGQISDNLMGYKVRVTNMIADASLFFQRSAVAVVFQKQIQTKSAEGTWVGARATRFNTDILMGVKQLGNTRSVRID